jgi:hypothetical protein
MGRKRKMKSTFINETRPGTLWLCHTTHNIVVDWTLLLIEQEDIAFVIDVEETIFPNQYCLTSLSQRHGIIHTTPLDDFFLYYRQIA